MLHQVAAANLEPAHKEEAQREAVRHQHDVHVLHAHGLTPHRLGGAVQHGEARPVGTAAGGLHPLA